MISESKISILNPILQPTVQNMTCFKIRTENNRLKYGHYTAEAQL